MPAWTSREFHEVDIRGIDPSDVMAAIHDLTWDEVPVFEMLMSIRGLNVRKFNTEKLARFDLSPVPEPDRLMSMFEQGFKTLYASDTELVFGTYLPVSAESWPVSLGSPEFDPDVDPVEAFRTARPANVVKVAFNLWIHDGVLSTETRNLPIGFRAAFVFRLYWSFIGPFSALIRRIWIQAIKRRASS
jgi:hypothetical protein